MKTARTIRDIDRTPGATTIQLERTDVLERMLDLIGARQDQERAAARAIARENLASAHNGPSLEDARSVVVSETLKRLQGSLLVPEDRRAVLELAQRLGMRTFDANLLVAMIQDRARRNDPTQATGTHTTHSRSTGMHGLTNGWQWICALATGALFAALAAAWLLGSI